MMRLKLCDRRRFVRAFTLVELLLVIGLIGVLIAMLLPAMREAREQGKLVRCQSNLRQVGMALQMYANQWKGWIYPPELGANRPRDERWPVHVFKPAVWNPPVMTCPSDLEPREEHSYLLNDHLRLKQIKFGSRDLGGLTPSEVIVMGAEPPTKVRGGAILGGIGAARPEEIGKVTEYVLRKAPCRVLLTAPADEQTEEDEYEDEHTAAS